jgi:membrane protein required for colicin V production
MLDIITAVLLVIAVARGLRQGLVMALFSLLAYIIGLAAALKLSAVAALYLERNVDMPSRWLPVISFIGVFAAVVMLIRFAGKFIGESLEWAFMGWANKLAGAIGYALLYMLIWSVLLFYAQQLQLVKPAAFAASLTWPWVQPLAPVIIENTGKLFPFLRDSFEALQHFFGQVAEQVKP